MHKGVYISSDFTVTSTSADTYINAVSPRLAVKGMTFSTLSKCHYVPDSYQGPITQLYACLLHTNSLFNHTLNNMILNQD